MSDPSLLDSKDEAGRTAMQRAALVYGKCIPCEEVVDFLIGKGACVDLCTAATFGLKDQLIDLVERAPEQIYVKCQGAAPLNWAVRPRQNAHNSVSICKALLAAGARHDDRDEDENGMAPLHHAAEWGAPVCLELVEILLGAGAEIETEDDRGWTALDYAKDRRRSEMIDLLNSR